MMMALLFFHAGIYWNYEGILYIFVGASLSEPHINGTAMSEFYIIIIINMVHR